MILTSEMYTTQAAAENGMASVKKNSPLDERYERKTGDSGKFSFNLKAGNHHVIGVSQHYEAEAGRDNGIESVKTNGSTTDVRDHTAE